MGDDRIKKTEQRIRQREQDLIKQRKRNGDPIPVRLTRREVRALATCDDNKRSQSVVDVVIRREIAFLQAHWTEKERKKRTGWTGVVRWSLPTMASLDDWDQDQDDGQE